MPAASLAEQVAHVGPECSRLFACPSAAQRGALLAVALSARNLPTDVLADPPDARSVHGCARYHRTTGDVDVAVGGC